MSSAKAKRSTLIDCYKCGFTFNPFRTTGWGHSNGHRCPKCGCEHDEKHEYLEPSENVSPTDTRLHSAGYVYFIRSETGEVKIGVSKDPKKRLSSLQAGNPVTLEILTTRKSNRPYELESKLHSILSDLRVSGEWFDLGNKTPEECLNEVLTE